jgi:hypothetical protein
MWDDVKQIVRTLYKNSKGEPFEMTDGQAELFDLIVYKRHSRNHIQTPTRYGKSEIISMAILTRATTFPEKWAIVAGDQDKAQIIMNYVIGHIFDNEYTRRKFIIGAKESESEIRRFRNKNRLNFQVRQGVFGEIFITTAKNAMGLGAPNVVEDESALIVDNEHALVMRMLGDQPENFLVKVGNPWPCEHFEKSFADPEYHKLFIDYEQAVREGRLTIEYVEEMRKQPFFDVLYECKFPKSGLMDSSGWMSLLTKEEIDRSLVDRMVGFGVNKLGVDVAAGGRNYSVIVQRHDNYAHIVHKTQDSDTMKLAEAVINLKKAENILPANISTDDVGKGVYDILTREIPGVYGVNAGVAPLYDTERFINLRAEMYWKLRDWILKGGKLESSEDWYQLTKIKYKVKLEGTKGKMQIMTKEDMLKDGIQSPDVADALAMTFVTQDIILPASNRYETGDDEIVTPQEKFDPFRPFIQF